MLVVYWQRPPARYEGVVEVLMSLIANRGWMILAMLVENCMLPPVENGRRRRE